MVAGILLSPRATESSGLKATTSKRSSHGSAPAAVACSSSGPVVAVSVALPATLYQPLPTSVTAPLGTPKAAAALLIVTVGVAPVFPVI